MDYASALISAFFYIFVIIDPFASLPIFISLTNKFDEREIKRLARDAVLIAGAIALVFLFTGNFLLSFLRIDLDSFKIAGGIVLGLLGIETVLGIKMSKNSDEGKNAVTTLIATPLLTGPGLITALIIMTGEQGYSVPLAATILALFVSWIILDNAFRIKNALGHQAIGILAKVVGLFLVAIGVGYVKAGLGA